MVSPLESLFDVIVRPREVFASLRLSPRWGLALAAYFGFKALTVFTLIPFAADSAAPALRSSLIHRGLSPDAAERVVESQFHGGLRYASSVGEAAKGSGAILVLSLMLWSAVAVKNGGIAQGSFVRQLAVVSHASVPLTIGNLFLIPLAVGGVPNYLNPAVSLQWVAPHLLLLAATSFADPFNLWMLALVVIGNAVVFEIPGSKQSISLVAVPVGAFVACISLLTWWAV